MHRSRHWPGLRSLKQRYLTIAALLVAGILIGSLYAENNVRDSTRITAHNLQLRHENGKHIRQIRDAVLDIKTNLENFLLLPRAEVRQATLNQVMEARRHVLAIKTGEHASTPLIRNTVSRLEKQLDRLHRELLRIMAARVTIDLQYPALRYLRENQVQSNRAFIESLTLLLHEAEDSESAALREHLLILRSDWHRMIAQFRLYLINRLSNINTAQVGGQQSDLHIFYQLLRARLDKLKTLLQAEAIDLLDNGVANALDKALDEWFAAYHHVIQEMPDSAWRNDQLQLETRTQPLFAALWETLRAYELKAEAGSKADIDSLGRTAANITHTLWLLTLFTILLVALGYIVLQRSVLAPLQTMARAIKAETRNVDTQVELPEATTRETRELVDAFTDLRQQVRYRQMALEYQATHDNLTGLPNRVLLDDRLAQELHKAGRNNKPLALILLDLDHFKEINDTLGHHAGDMVLRQVGMRLTRVLRASDTVARLGGDEFAIVLTDTDTDQARQIADKIRDALESPLHIEGRELAVGASQGIALFPRHGKTAQELLQRADVAMYVAKQGKQAYSLYDPEQDQHSVDRLELTNDLRQAIHNHELELYFQPQLDSERGEITGVEALLRWQHHQHGFIPPPEIVASAEKTGLIAPLTLWVIEQAITQCKAWQRDGIDLAMAVNLSVWNLHDPQLPQQIDALLRKHDLAAGKLTLEITETAMMTDPEHALETLGKLAGMGLHLSIDDFGTGFSSLAYLKRFPVRELKIDRTFVMDMNEDENDAVIVRSTIDLAHNLGLRVVAEGVEDEAALTLLEILGCDIMQGYHIGRPQPAAALTERLQKKKLKPPGYTARHA